MVDASTDYGNDVMERLICFSLSPVRHFLRNFNENGC